MPTAGLDFKLFEDLDHADVLKKFEKSVLQPDSLNFALDFDDSRASGARDLNVDQLKQLLASKVWKNPSEMIDEKQLPRRYGARSLLTS